MRAAVRNVLAIAVALAATFPDRVSGAIALVQSNMVEGSGVTSISSAFAAPNTQGNLLIAVVRMSTTSQTVTVTDSAGNAYADAVAQAQTTDGHQLHLFYAKTVAGGRNTVTATFSGTNNHPWLAIYEYRGLSPTRPLDRTGQAQGSGTPGAAALAIAGKPGELVFAATGLPASYTGTAFAAPGYSLLRQDTGRSRAASESAIVAAAGGYTASFALAPVTNWTAVVATFRPGETTTTLPPGTTTTSSTITTTTTWTTTSTTPNTTTTTLFSADGSAGDVHVFKTAGSSFDPYTANPTPVMQEWMRDHYWRLLAYSPYFDSRAASFPEAFVYQDLYAIYPGSTLASAHPEWILRDAAGNLLYIPYACGGGTCPQYAADPGNPGFRAWWVSEAKRRLAFGYRGVFVDDVNMQMQVSDGSARAVAPWDVRLGRTMMPTDWRRYVAEFTELIRTSLPAAEIVHNQVWFFAPTTDAYVQRAIAAADVIEIERGFNDSGIQAGNGTYGFETLAAYVDYLHEHGKGALLDVEVDWGREYALATYFLVSSGRDGLGNDVGTQPDAWWTGYDVRLGEPLGPRYAWNGLLRRDFAAGIVLVNEPQQPARTVQLGRLYEGLDGQSRTSVTLAAMDGVVLLSP